MLIMHCIVEDNELKQPDNVHYNNDNNNDINNSNTIIIIKIISK